MLLNRAELTRAKQYYVLSSLVVPRPIAWITTLNGNGTVNAAPFSYFQLMGDDPPMVALGIGARKHSFSNIRRDREFVINIVTEANAGAMSLSATEFPEGVSEIRELGLATEPSTLIKPPRLAAVPASMEARELQTVTVGGNPVIFGEILAVHLRDEFLDAKTLRVQTEKMGIIGRMQGGDAGGYTRTQDTFHVPRLSYEEWLKRDKPA